MAEHIQLRRDTSANWTLNNPILYQAEVGVETDTWLFKIGTGSLPWNSLDYVLPNGDAFSIDYTFSDTTMDSDPGPGVVRLGSTSQSMSLVMRADVLDLRGIDVTNLLGQLDDSTNPIKGYLRIRKQRDQNKWILFEVLGLDAPGGYYNINIKPAGAQSSGSPFLNGDLVTIVFSRTGDKGDTGLGVPGTNGATWYSGTSTPSSGLGVNGDFYLNTISYDISNKISGSWTVIGNIKGTTGAGGNGIVTYLWESESPPITGIHRRWYADRAGTILSCWAGVALADNTVGAATFDILKNGTTIYTSATKPSVPTSSFIGAERIPDILTFIKGDYFQIVVNDTGGASGPLRTYINFQYAGISSGGVTIPSTVNLLKGDGSGNVLDSLIRPAQAVAAVNLSAFDIVTVDGFKADSGTPAHYGKVVGITRSAVSTGFVADVIYYGEVTNGSWSWTAGQKLFLNGSTLSTTPPSSGFIQMVAIAKNNNTIVMRMETPVLF